MSTYQVAVVQAAPVLFDLETTLQKVESLVNDSAQRGAKLVLFPEAFLSVYPRGLNFGTVVGSRTEQGRLLWQKYWDSSVAEGDQACNRLAELAKKAQVFLVIGVKKE